MKQIIKALLIGLLFLNYVYADNRCNDHESQLCKSFVMEDIKSLFLKKDFSYIAEKVEGGVVSQFLSDSELKNIEDNSVSKFLVIKHFDEIFSDRIKRDILNGKVDYFDLFESYVISVDIIAPNECREKDMDMCEGGYMLFFKKENGKFLFYKMTTIG